MNRVARYGGFVYFSKSSIYRVTHSLCQPKYLSSHYKIIAMSPPEPSLIIRSNVSFNLYRAFSGIKDNFA
jgi:hypothetical protein